MKIINLFMMISKQPKIWSLKVAKLTRILIKSYKNLIIVAKKHLLLRNMEKQAKLKNSKQIPLLYQVEKILDKFKIFKKKTSIKLCKGQLLR